KAGNDALVCVLDVEEQRACNAVGTIADGSLVRLHAFDEHGLECVLVLVKERIAEDAQNAAVGIEALNDEVVVFTGFDERSVLAHARADLIVAITLKGSDHREGFTTFMHHKLNE